jgi:HEAT repeat protein
VPKVPGTAASEQFAQTLGKASPEVQRLLIGALALRADAPSRAAIEAAASAKEPEVRIAALAALGTCGDESSVKTFLPIALKTPVTPEGDAARISLVRLRSPRVNEALAGMLSHGDSPVKAELIRILVSRNATGTVAQLVKAAEDPDRQVRKEAWRAVGRLARAQDLPALLDLVVRTPEGEQEGAEAAVTVVLKRSDRPDLQPLLEKLETGKTPSAQRPLVRIASSVGDDAALPALRRAIQSEDAGVRDAAIRGLAAWPSPAAFDDLVGVARSGKESVHRSLALRAAIRLSSKVQGRTPEQTTALVAELMQLARDTAERKAVLGELGGCPTLAALHLAEKSLADPQLASEAATAVTRIASSIREAHRDEVLRVLVPMVHREKDRTIAGRAAKVLKDVLKPENLALAATASSPDGVDCDGSSGGDRAANDGDPSTYWDEVDGAGQYRLRLTFKKPTEVASINLLWHPFEPHQAKNFNILCDGKVVKEVRQAACFENEMFLTIPPVRCTTIELVVPGKNGLVSPCIHEFQVFGPFLPAASSEAPK